MLPRVGGSYSFQPRLISELFENSMWVLNFFRFYIGMILLIFYIFFGDNGANML